MIRHFAWFTALLTLSVTAGCVLNRQRPVFIPGEKDVCLSKFTELCRGDCSIKGLGQFNFSLPNGKSRKVMGVVYYRPGSGTRVDFLTNLGGAAVEILAWGDSASVYFPGERTQAQGSLTNFEFLRTIGLIGANPGVLPFWLLGKPGSRWLREVRLVSASGGENRCRMVFRDSVGVQHEVRFTSDRGEITDYKISWKDKSVTAVFMNFSRQLNHMQPYKILVKTSGGGELTIDYKQIKVGVEMGENIFKPRAGDNIRFVALDDINWEGIIR